MVEKHIDSVVKKLEGCLNIVERLEQLAALTFMVLTTGLSAGFMRLKAAYLLLKQA